MKQPRFFILWLLAIIFMTSCNRNHLGVNSQGNERAKVLSAQMEASKNTYVSALPLLNEEELKVQTNNFSVLHPAKKEEAVILERGSKSSKVQFLKLKLATKLLNNQMKKLQNSGNYYPDATDEEQEFQMNQKVKIGLILILAGIIIAVVLGWLGGIVSLVGVVFLVLGLLEM